MRESTSCMHNGVGATRKITFNFYINRNRSSFGLCSNNSDCYPADLNGSSIPSAYVNCSNQKCACSECFYATNSYRSCAYQRCWMYEGTTQTCIDLRKEQSTAFFLSLFLSTVGAANFYIERYDLGMFHA